jgi:hypothetical protein
MNEIKRIIKYLLSYRKSTWELKDYPIRIEYMDVSQQISNWRLTPVPWWAQIIGWFAMFGPGQTKEEALAELRSKFEDYKNSGKKLPRPGTEVAIVRSPTTQIQQYEGLAVDFFDKILKADYYECFISDDSSLWDFHLGESNRLLHRRIALYYKVDISDIENGNLVEIFKRISEHKKLNI